METSNNITTNKQIIKNDSVFNRIFDNDYLESLKYVANVIIIRDDVKNAYILLNVLKEAVAAKKSELAANKEIYNFYKKVIIRIRFIALPLLDDKEVIDLLANYFTWQFDLPDYDMMEKLSSKLTNILILADRDKFKASLKEALLANQETITNNAEIKTIADWLKNYSSKLGLGVADNLERTQYFIDLTKVKGVDEHYVNKLKVLFNFYEALKFSSLTPEGFDEEIPMMINNKLCIFRRGVLEPVDKIKGIISADEKVNNLEEFKKLAANYPVGSFERKAIEEEIKKLES